VLKRDPASLLEDSQHLTNRQRAMVAARLANLSSHRPARTTPDGVVPPTRATVKELLGRTCRLAATTAINTVVYSNRRTPPVPL